MAQLAQSDPAAWVAENQRRQSIVAVLGQLDQQISAERQEIERRQAEAMQQARTDMFQRTWAELQKDGIDREKLGKAYSDVSKTYGFSSDELAQVLDHRQVRVMLDALAYRQLKEQKAVVQKKVDAAPKLPQKATPTVKDRKSQQLEGRFKGGRAKLNDLASYLR